MAIVAAFKKVYMDIIALSRNDALKALAK